MQFKYQVSGASVYFSQLKHLTPDLGPDHGLKAMGSSPLSVSALNMEPA